MKLTKRLLFSAVLALASAISAHATYQIGFNTLNDLSTPTNPVFDSDLTTRLSGASGWVGQIYVSVGGGAFTAVKDVLDGTSGAKSFATSGAAGWITAGGDLTVNDASVTGNTSAQYQLRVWNTANGSTFEAAYAAAGAKVGVSGSASGTVNLTQGVSTTLLGYSTGTAPIGYPTANGFASFSVATVPEPATLALGLFGAAGLFIRRRK